MAWTDDPVADYLRYDAEQQRRLSKYPECDICGEHITDDYFYLINDEKICPECLKDNFRRDTEDYVE